jgi:hypothetical protein
VRCRSMYMSSGLPDRGGGFGSMGQSLPEPSMVACPCEWRRSDQIVRAISGDAGGQGHAPLSCHCFRVLRGGGRHGSASSMGSRRVRAFPVGERSSRTGGAPGVPRPHSTLHIAAFSAYPAMGDARATRVVIERSGDQRKPRPSQTVSLGAARTRWSSLCRIAIALVRQPSTRRTAEQAGEGRIRRARALGWPNEIASRRTGKGGTPLGGRSARCTPS